MKKNSLNVFHHESKYYLLSGFTTSLKWAWQRATKGYCDRDLWNLDDFYTRLFVRTLRELAVRCVSTPEKYWKLSPKGNETLAWSERLNAMSILFEDYLEESRNRKNEYYNRYIESIKEKKLEDILTGAETPESKQISNLYHERALEIYKESIENLHKALDMLKEDYTQLWD